MPAKKTIERLPWHGLVGLLRRWGPIAGAMLLGTAGLWWASGSAVDALRNLRGGHGVGYDANKVPEWIKVDVVACALAEAGVEPVGDRLAEPTIVGRLGGAIERSVWVDRVRLRKKRTTLAMDVVYRRPVLGVVVGERCCYVDSAGTVLPWSEIEVACLNRCAVLEGVAVPPAAPGARLADVRVVEAARLVCRVREKAPGSDILIVRADVGERGAVYTLQSRGGSQIEWGTIGTEPAEATKCARVADHLARHGSLDLPNGPYRFDVSAAASEPAVPFCRGPTPLPKLQ